MPSRVPSASPCSCETASGWSCGAAIRPASAWSCCSRPRPRAGSARGPPSLPSLSARSARSVAPEAGTAHHLGRHPGPGAGDLGGEADRRDGPGPARGPHGHPAHTMDPPRAALVLDVRLTSDGRSATSRAFDLCGGDYGFSAWARRGSRFIPSAEIFPATKQYFGVSGFKFANRLMVTSRYQEPLAR